MFILELGQTLFFRVLHIFIALYSQATVFYCSCEYSENLNNSQSWNPFNASLQVLHFYSWMPSIHLCSLAFVLCLSFQRSFTSYNSSKTLLSTPLLPWYFFAFPYPFSNMLLSCQNIQDLIFLFLIPESSGIL